MPATASPVRASQVRGVPEQQRRQLAVTGCGSHAGESFDGPRRGPIVGEPACHGERLAVQASRLVEVAGRLGHSAEVRGGEHDVRRRIEALGQRTRRLMAAGGLGELASETVDEPKTVDRGRLGDREAELAGELDGDAEKLLAASRSPRSRASDPSLVLIVECQPRSPYGRADVTGLADGSLGIRSPPRRLQQPAVLLERDDQRADVADGPQPIERDVVLA